MAIFSIAVVLSYLYFEIALIIKLYIAPKIQSANELRYHEGLGLFAPVIYLFEGGIKILEGLSPLWRFIQQILLLINSILLIASTVISYHLFKHKPWANVVIILLSLPLLIILYEMIKGLIPVSG